MHQMHSPFSCQSIECNGENLWLFSSILGSPTRAHATSKLIRQAHAVFDRCSHSNRIWCVLSPQRTIAHSRHVALCSLAHCVNRKILAIIHWSSVCATQSNWFSATREIDGHHDEAKFIFTLTFFSRSLSFSPRRDWIVANLCAANRNTRTRRGRFPIDFLLQFLNSVRNWNRFRSLQIHKINKNLLRWIGKLNFPHWNCNRCNATDRIRFFSLIR